MLVSNIFKYELGNRTKEFVEGNIPTIGDALTALDDLSNDLSATLKQISDINAELANKDHIGLENAQQVCSLFLPCSISKQDIDLDFARDGSSSPSHP